MLAAVNHAMQADATTRGTWRPPSSSSRVRVRRSAWANAWSASYDSRSCSAKRGRSLRLSTSSHSNSMNSRSRAERIVDTGRRYPARLGAGMTNAPSARDGGGARNFCDATRSGAVERDRSLAVGGGHPEVARRAVALGVVHDRRRVVGGQRTPVVVLEAGAGLGAGVLVAEAERVAELVAED